MGRIVVYHIACLILISQRHERSLACCAVRDGSFEHCDAKYRRREFVMYVVNTCYDPGTDPSDTIA